MSIIRISECTQESDGSNATLSFEYSETYPITITDPFTEEDEQRLEWYFEKYTQFPFTDQVKARNAGKSIFTYGEKLFKQVFANPDAYGTYKTYLQKGLNTLQIEIVGSST